MAVAEGIFVFLWKMQSSVRGAVRCLALFAFLVAVKSHMAATFAQGVTEERRVFIVDTVERPATEEFGAALQAACKTCGPLEYRHIAGSLRTGQLVAAELRSEEAKGRLALVVTLGKPATRIISDALRKTPIFYTMVGAPMGRFDSARNVRGFPTDAPVDLQLALLRRVAPGTNSVGIVVDHKRAAALRSTLGVAEGLTLYEIREEREMPTVMRRAVTSNDAIIFLRDPMVLNNDSVRFLMKLTLENRVHTVGYSKALVDLGLAFALVPDPAAFGKRVGEAAERHLLGQEPSDRSLVEQDYLLHRNETVIMQARTRQIGHRLSSKVSR